MNRNNQSSLRRPDLTWVTLQCSLVDAMRWPDYCIVQLSRNIVAFVVTRIGSKHDDAWMDAGEY
jgi:hypothetical protein